ncbi:Rossmann-like and DUF2520 domain-containing protein [Catalinimonas sp. 4WD22]|uniref:Rossmann-like and DUF2520 domain-containing protein n=1 Tax=Catalinimonas locisalis TaxID=3133978 RepID=UPI0031019E01
MSLFKKNKYYKLSIIGAGNVGTHLAIVLESAGHAIREVYSRHINNAQALCEQLYEAEVKQDLNFISSDADIIILAVPDDKIKEVAEKLLVPANAILLHTSGSMPMEVLEKNNGAWGVIYPLQTFSKHKPVNFQEIPILVEGSDHETQKTILRLSQSISKRVEVMSSTQRAVLHVSAVFACNFTNHMISVAEDLAGSYHINFELLKPLIAETINKSLSAGPKFAQTGPAIRGDIATLERQEAFLKKKDNQLAKIYRLLSKSIMNMHS